MPWSNNSIIGRKDNNRVIEIIDLNEDVLKIDLLEKPRKVAKKSTALQKIETSQFDFKTNSIIQPVIDLTENYQPETITEPKIKKIKVYGEEQTKYIYIEWENNIDDTQLPDWKV